MVGRAESECNGRYTNYDCCGRSTFQRDACHCVLFVVYVTSSHSASAAGKRSVSRAKVTYSVGSR